MTPSLLALVAALSPEAAAATFQIGWQAPEPVRYHAEAVVQTPRGFLYTSGQNIEVRGIRVDIQADLSCTGAPLGKVSKVVCTFSDVKMQAQAVPTAGAQQRIDQLFAENAQLLAGARLEMEIRDDGHVRSLDLEGIETQITRERVQVEQLRQLTRRLVAPLCVSLPKDGEGAKPWKHNGMPLFYELMSLSGTTGGLSHKYKREDDKGQTYIVGEGIGTLNTQAGMGGDPDGGATNVSGMAMRGASQVRWDAALGLPAYAEAAVTGEATASNMQLVQGPLYAYAGSIARILPDGRREGLEGPVGP
jgi:hypothetical protein